MPNYLKFGFLLLLVYCFACKKQTGKPSWETSILMPLVSADLTLNKLIKDTSYLGVDADGLYYVNYSDTLFSFSVDSLFDLPDTLVSEAYVWPFIYTASPGENLFSIVEQTVFDLDDASLTQMTLSEGRLEYVIQNSVKEKVDITLTLPGVMKDGILVEKTIEVPAYDGINHGSVSGDLDLAGGVVSMTGIDNSLKNTIVYSISISISKDAGSVKMNPGDELIIDLFLKDEIIEQALGYFGSKEFVIDDDEVGLEVFDKLDLQILKPEEADVSLSISNSVGVDASFILSKLSSSNTNQGKIVVLDGDVINKDFHLDRAILTGNSVLEPAKLKIDFLNTNIIDFMSIMPDMINFSYSFKTNPYGNISGGNDFVYSGSGLYGILDVNMPLSLQIDSLKLRDTLDFHLTRSEKAISNTLKNGVFSTVVNNGFPLNASLDLELIDDNNRFLRLISLGDGIKAAKTDGDGNVIEAVETVVQLEVDSNVINDMYEAYYIYLTARFSTPTGKYSKISENVSMKVLITGDFVYVINERNED